MMASSGRRDDKGIEKRKAWQSSAMVISYRKHQHRGEERSEKLAASWHRGGRRRMAYQRRNGESGIGGGWRQLSSGASASRLSRSGVAAY